MDQATRNSITLTTQQRHELVALMRSIGFELKPIKSKTLKSKWYRPPTLASLCVPYGKRMPWVKAGTTATEGSACYMSRVPLCPSNWPSDIAEFHADLQQRINSLEPNT